MYQFSISAPGRRSQFVTAFFLFLTALLGACGGGGGGDPPSPGTVTVTGIVTFDLVPVVPGAGVGGGLDYAATAASPARGVTVEFADGTATLASTVTDAAGAYSLGVPANRAGHLRVLAESVVSGSAQWDIRVVDNTDGNALYALVGADFNTGTQDSVRDLHAPSGWTGAGYGAPRAAAPFAILDAVRDGIDLVVGADPAVSLPPLVIHWSPDNIPSPPADGLDIAAGEIVSTFHSAMLNGIYVLGAADSDTDEYDRHVILHEWGHYLEDALARSDTIGGPHALGDILDMRVAFSEGWSNAFAAIAAGDSVYRDAMGPGQAQAPAFDVEGGPAFLANPGWFSERSVQEILYDVFDAAVDGNDSLSRGFPPLYAALTGSHGTDVPLTSLFSFVAAMKQLAPADEPLIDAILSDQLVDAVVEGYGESETNDAGAEHAGDVVPVYRALTVDGAAINVCSTDEFGSADTDLVNKLATRRFIRFELPAAAAVTLRAVATDVPSGSHADPDVVLHAGGVIAQSFGEPSGPCMDVASPAWQPADCSEELSLALDAGDHVIEVYEYTNTLTAAEAIGRTCFDVTVDRS